MAIEGNRGLILSRALLAAGAGIVPVPVVDETLSSLVRGNMLRRLAERRQVDLTREAIAILSEGPPESRTKHVVFSAVTLIALRRAWRKMFVLLAVTRRADEMGHTLELGTLFDHYCARHHVGAAIDGDRAIALRATMEQTAQAVRHEFLSSTTKRAVSATGRTLRRLPGGLLGMGMDTLRKWRAEGPSAEVVVEAEPVDAPVSLLGKATRVLEEDVGGPLEAYFACLRAAFDSRWKK